MFLSIIVPCFNEEEMVERFYEEVLEHIAKNKNFSKYEFIFIDDGSKDKTLSKIKKLREKDKSVRYVSFSRNFGKEAGIYAGLKSSKGDLVVLMDADLQHPPSLFEKMSDLIVNEGYDSVGAIREDRKGEGKIKSFLSRQFYKFINKISDTYIEENSTDYRMMTRDFVNSVLELSEYNRFTKGIFSWVGYKNIKIKYENVERENGRSKWSLLSLFKYSLEGIISFSTLPLIFSSLLGIICFLVSIIMLLVFLIKAMVFGDPVQGFPTIICTIFFLGGIQLLSIGVLGQYLAKSYLEVKNRPIYIAKETSEHRK
ncbi:bactoprenol glucosyl transferase [Peptostreptococcus russellii]|uniref:Bactoprenol glucosyl transferase n=1 Tax=Peptostreptococcus russellii TaxID=215200 RepID=A0A2P7Q276_9FIRM|nr:glycosyltransferase family 2 protein [Peptostreptococcus russellii]PSJ32059.1 bactoprenol glucosyl transferase [Peptostreptococcus russellii]